MGNTKTTLADEDLSWYEENTFFTKKEIIKYHEAFKRLCKKGQTFISQEDFARLHELRLNPFRDRIASVFATYANDTDDQRVITFDGFIDFLSVFSEQATHEVKVYYAFRVYDFDEDGYIDEADIGNVLKRVTVDLMSDVELESVVDKIFAEADIDGDARLSFVEFEHALAKAPDFRKYGPSTVAYKVPNGSRRPARFESGPRNLDRWPSTMRDVDCYSHEAKSPESTSQEGYLNIQACRSLVFE